MTTMLFRPYTKADFDDVVALFFHTVHSVNCADYTPAQLHAWAPEKPDRLRWQRVLSQKTIIAENDGRISAFAVWDGIGYLDCLYVHKDHLRCRLASGLCSIIESEAKRRGAASLCADVSLTARPFFEYRGYVVISQQSVHRAGETLINFAMKKEL